MISWQSIMSVFNTKGTLLKWLKTLDQSLKDGVLESVTVNSVSEGVITLSFNFADGSTITTPQIDIPQGAQGPEGPQGVPGVNGTNGESFNPMGEWVTDNEYHPFDYVTYNGSSYLCTATIIDGTDAPPLDTAHWQLVAEKGDPGDTGTGPNIPTPTTADNGKVLGVANGVYALQAASGGGGTQLYRHTMQFSESVPQINGMDVTNFIAISESSNKVTSISCKTVFLKLYAFCDKVEGGSYYDCLMIGAASRTAQESALVTIITFDKDGQPIKLVDSYYISVTSDTVTPL